MTSLRNVRDCLSSLWDGLADFDAARVEEAREHLLGGICRLIDARNATWIGAVRMGEPDPRDPVKGWRPSAVRQLRSSPMIEELAREQARMLEAGVVDHSTIANVGGAGRYRVSLLRELVPQGWFEGDYYRAFYLGAGHCDAIWAGVPINEDAESYFGFYRGLDQEPFGETEREIVDQALRGLRWFHRQQFLGEGLGVASVPLTRPERRVLKGLLLGLSEREISEANGHSPHTTHEYVKRLFRKYGVNSRAALTALWLGRALTDRTP